MADQSDYQANAHWTAVFSPADFYQRQFDFRRKNTVDFDRL